MFEYWNWCEKWICINPQNKLVRLNKVVESTHIHLIFKFMGHSISMLFYFLKVQTFHQSLSEICKCQKHLRHIYLWSKVVCFALFVTFRSPKPCCFMLRSWYLGKALMIMGALTWFEIVWSNSVEAIDYWIIFPMIIFLKIKAKNSIVIWGSSWCYWKALGKSDLIDFISQFSELWCGRYWFLSEICYYKFKQIAKIEIGRKNQLSHQCVHIRKFQN